MDWNLSWIFFWGLSFIFAFINLICLMICKKEKACIYLVFASLSSGIISVFQEIKIVNQWIMHGEFGLLEENVAKIQLALFGSMGMLIFLNLIDVVLFGIRQKTK